MDADPPAQGVKIARRITQRETAIRALFADCLDDEVVKEK